MNSWSSIASGRRLLGRSRAPERWSEGRRTTCEAGPAPVLIRSSKRFRGRGRPAPARPVPGGEMISETTRETASPRRPVAGRRRFPDRSADRLEPAIRPDPNLRTGGVRKPRLRVSRGERGARPGRRRSAGGDRSRNARRDRSPMAATEAPGGSAHDRARAVRVHRRVASGDAGSRVFRELVRGGDRVGLDTCRTTRRPHGSWPSGTSSDVGKCHRSASVRAAAEARRCGRRTTAG